MRLTLSKKQEEIVYAKEEAIYVEASAGSGKTRVITERIRYLLGKTKRQILALTFTNKAGEEIKERLKGSDIKDMDKRLFVGTFHGFCQYILENHGSSIGLSPMPHIFENDKDRLELISQAIEEVPLYAEKYSKYEERERASFKYRALDFISKVKRELILDSEFSEHTDDENIIALYKNYQDLLRVQNAIDFDDLLLLTYKLFINYPRISALYRRSFYAICIDEAQDLNNAQYKLLLSLTNREYKNIMMVGDSKQSIFQFTGSSPIYMSEKFVEDFSPIKFILNENYRSSKKVLKSANKILSVSNQDISNTVLEGEFELTACNNEFEEAQWIINKIKELIVRKDDDNIEGEIIYEKMAVLARNKYVFKELEEKLKEQEIPSYYKMTSSGVSFESEVMKIFDLGLRLKINPQDILHKEQLLSKLKINSNISLESIVSKLKNSIEKDILTIVLKLRNDGSNLKRLFKTFREKINLESNEKNKIIIFDIDALLEHWINYAKQTDKKSLHQFKNAMALGKTYSLTEHKGVTLSTVHTMKGQEFDIVFLMGMDEGTFPDYRAKSEVELNQEKNNLYVAFTRAKRFLYVTYPLKRTMPWGGIKHRKISRFLKVF